jgi:5'-nucleotidase
VGQWNRFAVQVTPQRIRVLLNGTPVNAVDRTAPTVGHIGLENRAGTDQVGFRDIQLTPGVVLGELSGAARRATTGDDGTADPGDESTLANFVADSQRWATRGSSGGNAKVALVASTSLQDDLAPADGAVTYADAAAAVAAEPLVNLRLTGAQVETVLEQQWQPDGGFVSLGASSGLTWTHDPARPVGERITGVWLDGAPLDPALNYSVTAAASLAAGTDDFPGFAAGIGRRTPDASTHSALAAYVGDASAGGPLAVPRTQRGVGVHVPGGATSWQAGTTYALDLSSWSYSATSDPVDDTVDVTVGGRSVGSFAVEDGEADPGEHGTIAVRAALPVDLPAGATTVEVVGPTTGTTVRLPITVTAAPAEPTPVPTPVTTPPGTTPPPTTTLPAAPTRAGATVKVRVRPGRVVARRTRARLVVTVVGGASTPTGKVTAKVGTRKVRGTLRDGRVVLRLPVVARPGRTKVRVSYPGDDHTRAARRTVRIRAVAP